MITAKDILEGERIELGTACQECNGAVALDELGDEGRGICAECGGNMIAVPGEGGWYAIVRTEQDDDAKPPWEREEGHGPVSEWRDTDSKRAGERVMSSGRGDAMARFYDFAEACRIALRDGWDTGTTLDEQVREAREGLTKRQRAARAAEADFERLRRWCNDDWTYIGVIVTLYDAEGAEVGSESLWGVESDGDYWKQIAVELIEVLEAQAGGDSAMTERVKGLTLARWEEAYGAQTHEPESFTLRDRGTRWIMDQDIPARGHTELWRLSDYVISTVTGGVVWLVRRNT